MAKSLPAELSICRLVRDAAFANPFSTARERLDRAIAGVEPDEASDESVVDRAVAQTRAALVAHGPTRLDRFEPEARETLRVALLFVKFHELAPDIDAFIDRQLDSDKPLVPRFADAYFDGLRKWGISKEDAERDIGFVYQVRRAFRFITTSLPGVSEPMRRLRARLWDNLFTHEPRLYDRHLWNQMDDFSVFFVGETGTGKGTAAAALGRSSWIGWDASRERFEAAIRDGFVSVNLSSLAEGLIESELFGHRKGAFTGAVDDHVGLLERCRQHGTIFLDEIGEVDVPTQIKLLRVLQERRFSPVGSDEERVFHGRVVAATNRTFEELREGRFRADFFYRLSSDVIEVPPLRDRVADAPEELELLVSTIVERYVGEAAGEWTDRVIGAIEKGVGLHYQWPGNVRELEQCIRQVLITNRYSGDPFTRGVGPQDGMAGLFDAMRSGEASLDELQAVYLKHLYDRIGTFEGVGRVAGIDRRTVKKWVEDDG